ncbi:helix-turn-helix transcriptional regulator [Brevibacillus sp. SYP-B805]|uniref:helix-turn-helix domain-containing protein n=1 Tax=Brevibacillus sp. SYP-B805 TaxID=1578199 RepID=UPI003217E36A
MQCEEELHAIKHELRQAIQRQMWQRGWKKTDLAQAANLYPSDLSNFMNGSGTRTFPLDALDAITEAFGLPPGHFYPLYFGECYSKGKLVRHRCEEFLYRCALLQFTPFVERIIAALLAESKSHLQTVYTVAKRLFDERKTEEALPLIETVIEHEANRFSQRLSSCYFYRFFIVRNKGMEQGYHALVQMLEYLVYMPLDIQLEAYLRIITFYFAQEDWKLVLEYAKRLEEVAQEGTYYGEALLYQSIALSETGRFEEALQLTDRYAGVSDYFADLAVGNRLFIHIKAGKTQYIDDLIAHLEANDMMYLGLPIILVAYLKAGQLSEARHFLDRFRHAAEQLKNETNPHFAKLLLDFSYHHASLLFATGQIAHAVDEILEAIRLADKLGNMERFKDSLRLFWQYHEHTSPDQKAKFYSLLRRSDGS